MEGFNEEVKPEQQKEKLVFLHYFGGSEASWNWVIEKLRADYFCMALSLPGFGGIPALKNPSIESFAAFVQEQIYSKGIKKYTLVGHSMGAKIAMQTAANASENSVQQLILIAPSPPTREDPSDKERDTLLHHTEKGAAKKIIEKIVKRPLSDEQFDLAVKTQLSTDPSTWRWWIKEGMKHSIANQLHHLSMPITIIASDDDPIITPHVIKNQVLPYLNNATVITVKDVGHLSPIEEPQLIASEIIKIMEAKSLQNNKKPELSYWHVWRDEKGISHQTKALLTSFKKEPISGDIQSQWNNHLLQSKSELLFSEQPVGWFGDSHENPKPQWIIPISGKWFVETMDGHRVKMGPGEISFGGDQNTKADDQGHQGHLSGTVGKEPAKLLIIQLLDKKWVAAKPGDFS